MPSIPVSAIVNISVAAPGASLGSYNPNTLAIVTRETPITNYGSGAKATATVTAGVITAINVVAEGSGYTVPPPVFIVATSGSGAQIETVDGSDYTIVNGGSGYPDSVEVVVGSAFQVYQDAMSVGLDWGTNSETYRQAVAIFSQSPNITTGGGVLVVYAMSAGQTLNDAVNGLLQQAYVGGIIYAGAGFVPTDADVLAAARTCTANFPPVLFGVPSESTSTLYSGGLFYQIHTATLKQARCLLFLAGTDGKGTDAALGSRIALAAYMSRGMATNFSGTLTASTQNLKQLVGIPADPFITSTLLNQCQTIGADVYCFVGTLPEVISTGGNDYFDNVFNLQWLVGALQVSIFNALATTSTKIPQTEAGVAYLRSAAMQVLEQAVDNGYLAPGTWNEQIPFGDPDTFLKNISSSGYYVYTLPLSRQSPADRNARKAPLIQIAVKLAGAVHSVNALINLNP
jgi:hypothetical protein